MNCNCIMTEKGIEYCPLHEAAPNMYEALEDFTMAYRRGIKVEQAKAYNKAMKALAKVKSN